MTVKPLRMWRCSILHAGQFYVTVTHRNIGQHMVKHILQYSHPVYGHGKTRDYLHRFNIIEEPTCPCGKGNQTNDHIIYARERLTKERETD